jgi:hypothetical protein
MSEVTRVGSVPAIPFATYNAGSGVIIGGPSRISMDVPYVGRVGSSLPAGEPIFPGDACFIFKGYVFRAIADAGTPTYAGVGTVTGAQRAKCDGFSANQAQKDEAVTLWATNVELSYCLPSFSVDRQDFYVSTTVYGGLATTPATVSSVVQPAVASYLGDGTIKIK